VTRQGREATTSAVPRWVTVREASLLLGTDESAIWARIRAGLPSKPLIRGRHEPGFVLVRSDLLREWPEAALAPGEAHAPSGPAVRPTGGRGAGRAREGVVSGTSARRVAAWTVLVLLLLSLPPLVGVLTRPAIRVPEMASPGAGVSMTPGAARAVGAPTAGVGRSAGSAPGEAASPGGLEVGTVAYVRDGRWASAAVTVSNPSTSRWLPDSDLLFVAVGRGRIVGTYQARFSLGPGASQTVIAQAIDLGSPHATLDRIDLRFRLSPWQPVGSYRAFPAVLVHPHVVTVGGGLRVEGTLRLMTGTALDAEVFCAVRDAAGRFVGAGLAYVEADGGGGVPFTVVVEHHGVGGRSAECYVGPQY
jgi:hypothetical protein